MIMSPVLHSFTYGFDYLREQVADVPPADMARQFPGVANHPAWLLGHVTFTCQMLGGVIGISTWLPEHWAERYGSGSKPVADVTAYDTKETLLSQLADAQHRMIAAVQRLAETQLNARFPDPAYLDVFPTVRHALTQVLVAHMGYHIGQLSVWRKAAGAPPMARAFE